MIQVESPGLFTTVQDLGRYGYGIIGVSPSGAADPIALRVGNWLVGNPEAAAGLEMTLLGGAFVFPEGGLIAATGSDFAATLQGMALPMWTACPVKSGQSVKFGSTRSGARCYLTVRGGISVKPFLGSASTHVLSRLGGLEGRPLRKGDALHVGNAQADDACRHCAIAPEFLRNLKPRTTLRTTIAPQTAVFSATAREVFYHNKYRVTEQSNRMGLRLEGPAVEAPYAGHMITEGVSLGAVQIPAGGQPIILFVEQQTTGGYPKIANVISADLSCVGQLRPNNVIEFELVSAENAQTLIQEQEKLLHEIAVSLGA